ncbi:DUF3343 domain-containing protein [uncultured Vagococcus sp.]|uniref:DUF3343 domain-containing protein n=1 Tax=uncultured Vagococcus sp. TaxID=189676 RepID=UPI0028D71197|nr:DUF3343 domain-containing protein [uncultured Vagococcus sp.]
MDYLVAFNSTHQAMEMESWVKERHLRARLIPTPESITASCGLALKFNDTDLTTIAQHLEKMGDQAKMYRIMIEDHARKTYTQFQLGGDSDE